MALRLTLRRDQVLKLGVRPKGKPGAPVRWIDYEVDTTKTRQAVRVGGHTVRIVVSHVQRGRCRVRVSAPMAVRVKRGR